MRHSDKAEEQRRQAAYNAYDSDAEAARFLGLNVSTFTMWRRKRGLVSKSGRGRPLINRSKEA